MLKRPRILLCGAFYVFSAAHGLAQVPKVLPNAAPPAAIQPVNTPEAINKALAETGVANPSEANPYLSTYLALQKQIAVLTKLLERENAVTDMVQSYKSIGIGYEPPKPTLSVCKQIPKNLACAVAYPSRYADFLPPPMPLPAVPVEPVDMSENELPQPAQEISPDIGLKDLVWTDITCLGQVCRAVITPDINDQGARYAVKVGDELPPGGVVESISTQGVFVSKGDHIVTLEPAPAASFAPHYTGT